MSAVRMCVPCLGTARGKIHLEREMNMNIHAHEKLLKTMAFFMTQQGHRCLQDGYLTWTCPTREEFDNPASLLFLFFAGFYQLRHAQPRATWTHSTILWQCFPVMCSLPLFKPLPRTMIFACSWLPLIASTFVSYNPILVEWQPRVDM